MQAPEEFAHPDIGSRRNWTVCWRWSVSVLAVEFALVMVLIGFAVSSRSDSRVKPPSQFEQAQQQGPGHSRKACPLVSLRKTQEL
jgi:hypothetical protein